MRKFLLTISFMLLIIFGIVSCGKNEENNKSIDTTKNEEQQSDNNNEIVEQDNQEENKEEENKLEYINDIVSKNFRIIFSPYIFYLLK